MKPTEEVKITRKLQKLLDETGPWVTLSDAARITGKNLQTLSSAARDGRLPSIVIPQSQQTTRAQSIRLVRLNAIEAGIGLYGKRGRPAKEPAPKRKRAQSK